MKEFFTGNDYEYARALVLFGFISGITCTALAVSIINIISAIQEDDRRDKERNRK